MNDIPNQKPTSRDNYCRRGILAATVIGLAGCMSTGGKTEERTNDSDPVSNEQDNTSSESDSSSGAESELNITPWSSPYASVEERNETPDKIPIEELTTLWETNANTYPVRFNQDTVYYITYQDSTPTSRGTPVIHAQTHDGDMLFTKEFDSIDGLWATTDGVEARVNKDRFIGLNDDGNRRFYTPFQPATELDSWTVDVEPHPTPGMKAFILNEIGPRGSWQRDARTTVGVANIGEGTIEWSQVFDFNAEDHSGLSKNFNFTNKELIPKTLIDSGTDTIYFSMILTNQYHDGTKFDHVYAYDLNTGEKRWDNDLEAMNVLAVTEAGILATHVYKSNPESVEKWYILDPLTGNKTRLDTADSSVVPNRDSDTDYYQPAIRGTTAYVPNGDQLVAFDLTSGEVKWQYLTTQMITSRPVVAANGIVYGTDSGVEIVTHDGEKVGEYQFGPVDSISAGATRIYAIANNRVTVIGQKPD